MSSLDLRGGTRRKHTWFCPFCRLKSQNSKNIIGWAAPWVRGFVNNFLWVPLACLGSREAVVQLWNSKKTIYKTSYPSRGPSLYNFTPQVYSVSYRITSKFKGEGERCAKTSELSMPSIFEPRPWFHVFYGRNVPSLRPPLQGDHSRCSQTPVDTKTKVAF